MSCSARQRLFHSSEYNFDPSVTDSEAIRLPITVTDVTLREGQQAAEVYFSPDDEIEIAHALDAIGIPVIQVGFAGTDNSTVARIREACPQARICVLLVGWKDDVSDALESARKAGADVCSVLIRAGERHLADLGYTHEWTIRRARNLVEQARDVGYGDVICAPSFATTADFDFLMRLYSEAIDAGATVVSLADSSGTAKPAAVSFLVNEMRRLDAHVGIRVHMHDDFGLALANTLAGVAAGANWVDVTVNGLGERAGNCALEEFVVALEGLYGVRLDGIRTEALFSLCQLVAGLSSTPIPPMKPVVGGDVFANKLEIHLKAAASDPSLMEPYDPAAVGNRRTVRLGRGTGPTGVQMKLQELRLSLAPELVDAAVKRIDEIALETKHGVTDGQFRALVDELHGEPI